MTVECEASRFVPIPIGSLPVTDAVLSNVSWRTSSGDSGGIDSSCIVPSADAVVIVSKFQSLPIVLLASWPLMEAWGTGPVGRVLALHS